MTKWCPNCGSEYREGVETCVDCDVALVDTQPEQEDEGTEVVVYELGEWTEEQRGELDQRLQGEGIPHQWETAGGADTDADLDPVDPWALGTDLVIGEKDEEAVDRLLDEIEHPDELEAIGGDSDAEGDGDAAADEDEASYNVMSHLYVAADRLKDDPGDLALAGEFFDASDAARTIQVPFGIDGDVWNKVLELAGAVTVALEEEAEDDAVRSRAKELRDLLFTFV